MKLRVVWYPQVPCEPFHVDVKSVKEGTKIMDILASYDTFQYENSIKPDYCNTGVLQMIDPEDEHEWIDWEDEETGITDPYEYLTEKGKL